MNARQNAITVYIFFAIEFFFQIFKSRSARPYASADHLADVFRVSGAPLPRTPPTSEASGAAACQSDRDQACLVVPVLA
jgi:hypothetical protein